MPITWKNLGQSANTGNRLIAGASDTIAQGLDSLRGAAQDVTNEQNRQFQTQADVNTAGILSDINRLDQDGVDSFDVNALSKQFGSQFDATGISSALDSRVGELNNLAQQETENTRANTSLDLEQQSATLDKTLTDSTIKTNVLNQEKATGQIAAQKLAKTKADNYSAFSKGITSDLANYKNVEDIKRTVARTGFEKKMSSEEITKATNATIGLFNNTLAIQKPQQAKLDAWAVRQADFTKQSAKSQLAKLNNEASNQGINLDLVKIANEPDSADNSMKSLSTQYDKVIKDSTGTSFGKEDSVVEFKSLLDKKFDEEGLGGSTQAELAHFLSLGFDPGRLVQGTGFDFGKLDNEIKEYVALRKNKKGLEAYNTALTNIKEGVKETSRTQTKALKDIANKFKANNRTRFTGTGDLVEEGNLFPTDIQDLRSDSLRNSGWFSGVPRQPKS